MEDSSRNGNPLMHLMRMIGGRNKTNDPHRPSDRISPPPLASTSVAPFPPSPASHKDSHFTLVGTDKRAEVGHATWTFLHTLAAQLPDRPSRQQQKDVKSLLDILTCIYPCGECAEHWQQVIRP